MSGSFYNDITWFIRETCSPLNFIENETLSSFGKDISLSTDKFLNRKIVEYLTDNYSYPVLSEESEEQRDYCSYEGYYWIIDPLDGTLNYSRGIPLTCISIALWQDAAPVAGIVYDFQRDEMFYGCCKRSPLNDETGAWLNDSRISVSGVKDRSQGVICTGFPSWRDFSTESLDAFVKKIQRWKKVRLLGSAALSLAWVASGRADAYTEEDIRIWDVAAGLALVKAAGGTISYRNNTRANFITALAVTKEISIEEIS